MSWQLRRAGIDDLDAIMAIEHRSFPTDAWSVEAMALELASPHGRYLVDELDGAIIGYGGVRALEGSRDADIQTIAVAESALLIDANTPGVRPGRKENKMGQRASNTTDVIFEDVKIHKSQLLGADHPGRL